MSKKVLRKKSDDLDSDLDIVLEDKHDLQTKTKFKAETNNSDLEDLKLALQETQELIKNVYEQNLKIKRRITVMVVGTYLKLLLIVLPLILGVIYLPPLIKNLFDTYKDILNNQGINLEQIIPNADLNNLLKSTNINQNLIKQLSK